MPKQALLYLLIFQVVAVAGLILIGSLPKSVLRIGMPLFVLLGIAFVVVGFFGVWFFSVITGFSWDPFAKAKMPTSDLKGIDFRFARAMDFIGKPLSVA
jgi:hypothetical protein